MDFFHFAATNLRFQHEPRYQTLLDPDAARRQKAEREALVTKYLTKPIQVTPFGGGEDNER